MTDPTMHYAGGYGTLRATTRYAITDLEILLRNCERDRMDSFVRGQLEQTLAWLRDGVEQAKIHVPEL